eukprot:2569300-Amphidinium_carterae.2
MVTATHENLRTGDFGLAGAHASQTRKPTEHEARNFGLYFSSQVAIGHQPDLRDYSTVAPFCEAH